MYWRFDILCHLRNGLLLPRNLQIRGRGRDRHHTLCSAYFLPGLADIGNVTARRLVLLGNKEKNGNKGFQQSFPRPRRNARQIRQYILYASRGTPSGFVSEQPVLIKTDLKIKGIWEI